MSDNDTCPPSERRCRKNTANRGGRPKGSKNLKTMLRDIMLQEYVVTEDGKKKRRTMLQIALLQLRKEALEGTSPRAMKKFGQVMERYRPGIINEGAGVLLAPAEISAEDWIKRELEENKTLKPPPGVDDIYDDGDDD
ncbi:DUF5681 domain-containing protein [Sneathiella sp.]|uniref:DUF5681 domain-containing protein n=1 Tax=Sneathiella sp. TaxID=1964365 RepID=UPI002591C773|nr:DUF5681 domain-containing protein [Sneathiella sp.]MDF2369041.1 DUF5681 domain-containing protein [Sneathiella sp.]